jgi:uncharacterized membrane protein YeaQ/YmgE (transglycosylase-associated protein family)
MNMLWFVLVLLFFGLMFGALARLMVPGPDSMGLLGTWVLGIVGSFVGGFLGFAVFGADVDDGPVQVGGVVGSIIGAVIVLLVFRRMKHDRRVAA